MKRPKGIDERRAAQERRRRGPPVAAEPGRPAYSKVRPKDWPSACRKAYEIRGRNLERLGYADYQDYLRSDLWAAIRRDVFAVWGTECLCGAPASGGVHHGSYDLSTLQGAGLRHLWPICRGCHRAIEYTGEGRKRPPAEATRIFPKLAKRRRKRREVQKQRQQRQSSRQEALRRVAQVKALVDACRVQDGTEETVLWSDVLDDDRRRRLDVALLELADFARDL